jgi:hypothetical protein
MKAAARPWRDPGFYGFVLFAIALLCSSLLCLGEARTARVAESVRPSLAPAGITRPSGYALTSPSHPADSSAIRF